MKNLRQSTVFAIAILSPALFFIQSSGADNSPPSTANPSYSGTNAGTSDSGLALQRITQSSLKDQLTAKDLLSKEVYDRNHQKVGKVVDIVLMEQSGSLASAFARDTSRQGGSSGLDLARDDSESPTSNVNPANSPVHDSAGANSNYASTTAPAGHGTDSSYVASSRSPIAGTPANSRNASDSVQAGAMSGGSLALAQTAVIISHSGKLGMGKELLRVPLSQLSYDANSHHLVLDASVSDISRVSSPGN